MNSQGLAKRFSPLEHFQEGSAGGYALLPFRFHRMPESRVLLTNDVGEYLVLPSADFDLFAAHQLDPNSAAYEALKSRHFLLDGDSSVALDLLALKARTKFQHIKQFTSLHIFVVSLRCDYSCPYCQVSRQTTEKGRFDMSEETALAAIDFTFKSPSPAIKIEFQGGEPLLNLPLIRFVVANAKKRNETEKRDLQFVIATNLSYLDSDVLAFCEEHDIFLSTSLDGPEDLHNKNRPRPGQNGHALTVSAIETVRSELGRDRVAALMTTTEASLGRVREIVDEYLLRGFSSIFLRSLSPYGFAVKTKNIDKYNAQRWLDFYKDGLAYIIELNKQGIPFREEYAALILTQMLTPYAHRYVDLQSPAGIAISAIVFNYDGDVYASDESRMLAEMGDKTFRLGQLGSDSYEAILGNDVLLRAIEDSITESVPMCRDCAFKPYCGSDPVYHYATQRDWVGHKAKSGFCKKNMGIFQHLIELLEGGDEGTRKILEGWART